MKVMEQRLKTPAIPPSPEEAAIGHLKQAVASGRHWFLALLEAMGMWSCSEEEVRGVRHRYLIGKEAFDWQALAQRLCSAVDGLLPHDEVERFVVVGLPPLDVPAEQMQRLLGPGKYQGYLNYLYGVVIERSLLMATAEEIRREWEYHCCRGPSLPDEVCRRVYGAAYRELVQRFRRESGAPYYSLHEPSGRKEFTYWLFKHRVRTADKARLASDTKKGLEYWQQRIGVGAP